MEVFPTTFDEAINVLEKILLRKIKRTSRPISFSLVPLQKFGSTASRFIRSLSDTAVVRTCNLKNYQERCLQELNDLIQSELFSENSFSKVRIFIEEVKRIFSDNSLKFNERLCNIFSQIKGGELEEDELFHMIEMFGKSRFGEEKFMHWYDDMKLEIRFLEEILTKIKTNSECSLKNNIFICKSKLEATTHYSKHKSVNGWYELNIKLLSFMDIKVLDHLETEFSMPKEGNDNNYPMHPGFLNDDNEGDTKFVNLLSHKIDTFTNLANFKENVKNKDLCFLAVIEYPSKSENGAYINFKGGGLTNNDVNLDFLLQVEQIYSHVELFSQFSCKLVPNHDWCSRPERYSKAVQKFPDTIVDFRYKSFDEVSSPMSGTTEFIDKESFQTSLSLRISSSIIPYVAKAYAKFIGGAVCPPTPSKMFYAIQFANLRYGPGSHELRVDVLSNSEMVWEMSSDELKFYVEFRYRNVESDPETFSTLKGDSEDLKYFSAQLDPLDNGYFECQCRYVVKKESKTMFCRNSGPYFLIKGGENGVWSPVQYLIIGKQ